MFKEGLSRITRTFFVLSIPKRDSPSKISLVLGVSIEEPKSSNIKTVEDFGSSIDTPKTKEITEGLSRSGIDNSKKVLVILDNPSSSIKKSIKNISNVRLMLADQLNVFDILNADDIVIGNSAISKIEELYS